MQRKRLVLLKERNLLFNSQVLDEVSGQYPWLQRFLEEKSTATYANLNNYDIEVRNFFKNRYDAIVKQAVAEWGMSDNRPVDIRERDEMVECELCHQRPIVYVCGIKNKLNNIELNVGSECVKNFGMSFTKDIQKLLSAQKKLKRLNVLDKSIVGIEGTKSGWGNVIDHAPILIPEALERPFLKLGEAVKKLYDDFVNETSELDDNEIVDTIRELLAEKDIQHKRIDEYVDRNSADKFAPTREIVTWARREAKDWDVLLGWLKEDGMITARTAFRVGYPPFLKSLIPDFDAALKSSGVTLQGVEEHKHGQGYVTSIQSSGIKLFCNYREFISSFSDAIFKVGRQIDIMRLVNISSIYGEESISGLLDIIRPKMETSDYSIYRFDREYNEIIFEEKGKERYVVEDLEQFTVRVKYFVLPGYSDNTELDGYIRLLGTRKKQDKDNINYFLEQRR
jgi:hypothetical protein